MTLRRGAKRTGGWKSPLAAFNKEIDMNNKEIDMKAYL